MERRSIVVSGIVQGVGFRPFVHGLASRMGLAGFVKNQSGDVVIEVEGESTVLDLFLHDLAAGPPPLARIGQLRWESRSPRGESRFRIEPSGDDPSRQIFISPDIATCRECLREIYDPRNRRHRYPFTNCTHCGPRLTIVKGAPYDRERTTMAAFTMCATCRVEYEDPADRRFHAQPTACPECGPRLWILDASGHALAVDNPLARFAAALLSGAIGALKGLGGYHLACDARNVAAVAELRRRKRRDEKPFTVMVPDVTVAESLCEVSPAERSLLQDPAAPIVLLQRRPDAAIAADIAPRNPWLGVMLPYTPLHHLLQGAVGGIPLVMTSGNRSDEPIAHQDDAPARLAGIADLLLTHDRPIHVRCDDSVTRIVDGAETPVRRSRGYAPRPIELPVPCPRPFLALGGQLKVTFALGRDHQAFLSHHMGDLDHHEAFKEFQKDVALYQQLLAITPECLVHDLHPDYVTTRFALARAEREGVQLLAVQHHHAHMASCMAEHGLDHPVIGVAFDGSGYGTDGAIWGGEFLVGDYQTFRRGAHLRYVGMPGGERAIREPWRMALAHLIDAGEQIDVLGSRISQQEMSLLKTMLDRRINTPATSSAGRLFDAVAALAGVRDRVSFEGQAAMELEGLAGTSPGPGDRLYPFELRSPDHGAALESPLIVDTRPLIRAVAEDAIKGEEAATISRRFHATLAEMIAAVCARIGQVTGLRDVVLSGGVFLNALLTHDASARLARAGFRVHRHRLVPPGDGGLSLGQIAVAASIYAESNRDGRGVRAPGSRPAGTGGGKEPQQPEGNPG
jgi:hydrogenase maturation protein HypF